MSWQVSLPLSFPENTLPSKMQTSDNQEYFPLRILLPDTESLGGLKLLPFLFFMIRSYILIVLSLPFLDYLLPLSYGIPSAFGACEFLEKNARTTSVAI